MKVLGMSRALTQRGKGGKGGKEGGGGGGGERGGESTDKKRGIVGYQ